MSGDRREFLGQLAAGAMAVGGLAAAPRVAEARGRASNTPHAAHDPARPTGTAFDMSWVERMRGRFRAVFDSPKLADGGEAWRAGTWRNEVAEAYGAADDDITAVLVIRRAGIPLVLDDTFWTRHQIGRRHTVRDQATGKVVTTNPTLGAADTALGGFMKRGGIVLACNLAFEAMVSLERAADRKRADEARARTLAHLVPGVIMQPSGFFAVLEAQRAGCHLFAPGE